MKHQLFIIAVRKRFLDFNIITPSTKSITCAHSILSVLVQLGGSAVFYQCFHEETRLITKLFKHAYVPLESCTV